MSGLPVTYSTCDCMNYSTAVSERLRRKIRSLSAAVQNTGHAVISQVTVSE